MKILRRTIRNTGFGITEVLVALALLGVVSVFFAQMIGFNSKATKSLSLSADHTNLVNLVGQILASEQSCSNSFVDLSFTGGEITVNDLKIGTVSTVHATASAPGGGSLWIHPMTLKQVAGSSIDDLTLPIGAPAVPMALHRYWAVLTLKVDKDTSGGPVVGGAHLPDKQFYFRVDTNSANNKIVQCSSDILPKSAGSFSVTPYIYNNSPNGRGDTTRYPWCVLPNPVTGKCSCPEGFLPYKRFAYYNPTCVNATYCVPVLPDDPLGHTQWVGGGMDSYECFDPNLTPGSADDDHSSNFTKIPACRSNQMKAIDTNAGLGLVQGQPGAGDACCYDGNKSTRIHLHSYTTAAGVTGTYSDTGVMIDNGMPGYPGFGPVMTKCF
jgi:hypothetical protein